MAVDDERWDRRVLRFAIGFPLLLAVGFTFSVMALSSRLPDPVAWAWDGEGGRAFLSLPGYLVLGALSISVVGALLCAPAASAVRSPAVRRLHLGGGVGVSMFLTTVFAAGLIGQIELPDARASHPDPVVLALGCGAALAFGVVIALSFKPPEGWGPRDEAALFEELNPELVRRHLVLWTHARSSVFVMIGIVAVPAAAFAVLVSPWASLALLLLTIAGCSMLVLRVVITPEDLSLSAVGVVPLQRLDSAAVLRVEAVTVRAGELGGWGYRRRGPRTSVLVASGPAVEVWCEGGRTVVFSVPDDDAAFRAAEAIRGSAA